MRSVDEVDISKAGGAEHDGISRGEAGKGVGSGIFHSEIGFDFNDTGGEKSLTGGTDEDFAEQVASNAAGSTGEEGARQGMRIGWVEGQREILIGYRPRGDSARVGAGRFDFKFAWFGIKILAESWCRIPTSRKSGETWRIPSCASLELWRVF